MRSTGGAVSIIRESGSIKRGRYRRYHTLEWRHNGRDGVSNHQPHHCLFNRLFRRRSKKTSKLCVTGLVWGIHRWPMNSSHKWPVTRKMFPFDDVIMKKCSDGSTDEWMNEWMSAVVLCFRVQWTCTKSPQSNHLYRPLKTKDRQFDNCVVTGGTVSCH